MLEGKGNLCWKISPNSKGNLICRQAWVLLFHQVCNQMHWFLKSQSYKVKLVRKKKTSTNLSTAVLLSFLHYITSLSPPFFSLLPRAKRVVPACASTSSLRQKASLRNWWGRGGFRARGSRQDRREGGVLGKPPAVGPRAQDTLLKLKWLLGCTFWMALTPLFTWPGTSPVAILD